jgi:hypothetical protein
LRPFAAFAVSAWLAGTSQAQSDVPFPQFDTRQFCRVVTRAPGKTPLSTSDCIREEAHASSLFKEVWPKLSSDAQEACIMQARQYGGSYILLKGCVLERAGSKDMSSPAPADVIEKLLKPYVRSKSHRHDPGAILPA